MKRYRKIIGILLSTMIATTSLVGCKSSSQTNTQGSDSKKVVTESVYIDTETFPNMIKSELSRTGKEANPIKKEGTLTIGFCPTAMDTYYERVLSGLQEEADKIGNIKLDVQAPSGQSAIDDSVRIMESWIASKKVDVIAIAVRNEGSLDPLFKQATEAGIPILLFNSPEVSNPYYVSNIGYDQAEGGRVQAEWVGQHYKDAGQVNAGFVLGSPTDVFTKKRMEGFNEVIAKYPNIKIVDQQAGNWVRSEGEAVTADMLTSHPEINAIFSLYDEMSLGSLQAIKTAGKKVDIVGYENMKEVNSLIKNGTEYLATVDTGAKEVGRNIARAAYKYAVKGDNIPKTIFVTPVAYDKTNIDKFPVSEYGNSDNN